MTGSSILLISLGQARNQWTFGFGSSSVGLTYELLHKGGVLFLLSSVKLVSLVSPLAPWPLTLDHPRAAAIGQVNHSLLENVSSLSSRANDGRSLYCCLVYLRVGIEANGRSFWCVCCASCGNPRSSSHPVLLLTILTT